MEIAAITGGVTIITALLTYLGIALNRNNVNTKAIREQVTANDGHSLLDAINRIEARQTEMTSSITEIRHYVGMDIDRRQVRKRRFFQ